MVYEDSCLVNRWDSNHVFMWISGFDEQIRHYAYAFLKDHLDGKNLLLLTDNDLLRFGLKDANMRKKLLSSISKLIYLTYEINDLTLQRLYINSSVIASDISCFITSLLYIAQHSLDNKSGLININILYDTIDNIFHSIMNLIRNLNDIINWLGKYSINLDNDLETIKVSTCFLCLEIINMSTKISNILILLGQRKNKKTTNKDVAQLFILPSSFSIMEYHEIMERVVKFCRTVVRAAGKMDPLFVTPSHLSKIIIKYKPPNTCVDDEDTSNLGVRKESFTVKTNTQNQDEEVGIKKSDFTSSKRSRYKFVYDHLIGNPASQQHQPAQARKPSFISYAKTSKRNSEKCEPRERENLWGLQITIENDWHIISAIEPNSPAGQCQRLGIGAEVVQIDTQVIVGWDLDRVCTLLQSCSPVSGGGKNSLTLLVRSYFTGNNEAYNKSTPSPKTAGGSSASSLLTTPTPKYFQRSESVTEETGNTHYMNNNGKNGGDETGARTKDDSDPSVPPKRRSKTDDDLEIGHKGDHSAPSPSSLQRKSLVKKTVLEYIEKVYHDDSKALTSPSTQKTLDMVKGILTESTHQLSPTHLNKYGMLPPEALSPLATDTSHTVPLDGRVNYNLNNILVSQDNTETDKGNSPSNFDLIKDDIDKLRARKKMYWKNREYNMSVPETALHEQTINKNKGKQLYTKRLETIPLNNYLISGQANTYGGIGRSYFRPSVTLTSVTGCTGPLHSSLISNNSPQTHRPVVASPISTTSMVTDEKGQYVKNNKIKKSLTFLCKYFKPKGSWSSGSTNKDCRRTTGSEYTLGPAFTSYLQDNVGLKGAGTPKLGGNLVTEGGHGIPSGLMSVGQPQSQEMATLSSTGTLGTGEEIVIRRKSPPYILPFYGNIVQNGPKGTAQNNLSPLPKASIRRLRSSSEALDLAEPLKKLPRINRPMPLIIPQEPSNVMVGLPSSLSGLNKGSLLPSETSTMVKPNISTPDNHKTSWVLVKNVALHHNTATLKTNQTGHGEYPSVMSPLDDVVRMVSSPSAILPPSLNQGWYQTRADLCTNYSQERQIPADFYSRDHLYLHLESPSWSNTQNKVDFKRESYYLPDFMVKPSIRMHNCIKLMNRDMILYMALSSHGDFKKWLQLLKPISNGHYHIQQTISSSDNLPSSDDSKSSPKIATSSLQKNTSFNDKLEKLRTLFKLSPNVIRRLNQSSPKDGGDGEEATRRHHLKFPNTKYLMGKALKFASAGFHGDNVDK